MVTLWSPTELDEMNLPPCVHTTHWIINADGTLDLKVMQRSCDVALGLPFNIAQYAFLHRLIAKEVGLKSRNIYWSTDDCHIYVKHIKELKEQTRYKPIPKDIKLKLGNDYENIRLKDIDLENYDITRTYSYDIAVSGGGLSE